VQKLILFGGKGGTGKSTIASATSVFSSKNFKTCIISFDIAHSLSDIFDTTIEKNVTKISHNLFALEPDPNEYAEKYAGGVLDSLRTTLEDLKIDKFFPSLGEVIDEVRPESLPMAIKSTIFFEYIIRKQSTYDVIIVDFPSTASMLSILEFPKLHLDYLLGKGLKASKGAISLLKLINLILNPSKREPLKNDFVKEADKLRARVRKLNEYLKMASLRLVTIPERASIKETYRIVESIKDRTNLDSIYINHIIPDSILETNPFLKNKEAMQTKYVMEVRRKFSDKIIWEVPEVDFEPLGLSKLEELAKIIYTESSLDKVIFS
jgi:arsenite-transporting ATPase